MSKWTVFSTAFYYIFSMDEGAAVFWQNVKREIKQQNTTHEWVAKKAGISFNTFQGWISKGIYPRVHEAVCIAAALNTSVEYLVIGAIKDNTQAVEIISGHLAETHKHLEAITAEVKKLR